RGVRRARAAADRPDGAGRAPAHPAHRLRLRHALRALHPGPEASAARGASARRGDADGRRRRGALPGARALLLARSPAAPSRQLARPLAVLARSEPPRGGVGREGEPVYPARVYTVDRSATLA